MEEAVGHTNLKLEEQIIMVVIMEEDGITLTLSQIIDLNANDQVRIRGINRIHCNGTYSRFSGYLVA